MSALFVPIDEHFDLDFVRVHANDAPFKVLCGNLYVVAELKLRPRNVVSSHKTILHPRLAVACKADVF